MTATLNGTARTAARDHWLAERARGVRLTGDQLAERYGRSPSWGRARIREAEDLDPSPAVLEFSADDPEDLDEAAEERPRPWWVTAITVAVALIAAAASYGHQVDVALSAGEPVWIAHLLPLTVDGLVVAALWAGRRGRAWLVLALAVSGAANIASADPTPTGIAVGAWPPVALFGTHRLLHRSGRAS